MAAAGAKPIAVITGASRGIGLGLVEVYVAKGYRVVAAVRDPAKADKLNALVKAHGASLQAVKLDVSDSKSIAALPAALAALSPAVKHVDVLINNAGIITGSPKPPGTSTTLATETEADLAAVFHTNVIGVFTVTNTLLPLLRASPAAGGAKVVNIGSILGSVDFIISGPWPPHNPAYLISKSALNQLSAIQARTLNADAVAAEASTDAKVKAAAKPLITVVSMHPGWVDTDMGTSGGGKPPVTVPQSAGGIESVVSKLKPSAKVLYLDFEGKTLNW